jgi:nucleotide-binding universal stress UspA family protein
MTKILCPTRGGQASYPNQDFAIELAKEKNADLLFLYVSSVRFLGRTASPVVVDVQKEIDEMGEFLLTMAQERAGKSGVQADGIVRRGTFHEVLEAVVQENQIHIVVLGTSAQDTGFTTQDYMEELSAELSSKTGAEFIVVYQGEVISKHKPGSN